MNTEKDNSELNIEDDLNFSDEKLPDNSLSTDVDLNLSGLDTAGNAKSSIQPNDDIIFLEMSIEVDCKKINLTELKQLHPGSVISLNKKVGEPVNIKLNGTTKAYGQIVEENGTYGVRITKLVNNA
ncbi:FliM/FliN family flagellar motor switch protein [Vibrio breoganii]|uniref:FliM/FliN family flagellar motor switch protein n=1 Tax=Vibrio breoganii TaxID=553239 RepID=UPI0009EDB6B0|nr:FliM/FliN family flagellar motor switch protein [Vibrio breoganii]